MNQHQLLNHFLRWNDAVKAAGFKPNTSKARIDNRTLLKDWGEVVRKLREIPTLVRYRREGKYSPDVFQKRFGPWSALPDAFRNYAADNPEWVDVVAFLPVSPSAHDRAGGTLEALAEAPATGGPAPRRRHSRLADRATYGNPIDFRGLRHEPVNEQGVVFLFGMVAKELGYMVEVVRGGFPDCEAKRCVGPNSWQGVQIEFEFESRNFRDHGHPHDGCDVVVCWRDNWPDRPANLEVVQLCDVIRDLSKGDD